MGAEDHPVPHLTAAVEEQPLVGVGVETSAQASHLASRQRVDELLDGTGPIWSPSAVGAAPCCVPVADGGFGGVLALSGVLVLRGVVLSGVLVVEYIDTNATRGKMTKATNAAHEDLR
jgi:hypothetical protein